MQNNGSSIWWCEIFILALRRDDEASRHQHQPSNQLCYRPGEVRKCTDYSGKRKKEATSLFHKLAHSNFSTSWGARNTMLINMMLTGGNWQKWKSVFLTCPCHKIYRDEAVGLKVVKILEKLRYLWKCEIWGNIVKIWYFVNNCLIKARILKILLHMCDTYNYDYLKYSTFRFNFINFLLYIDFPFQFCVFYRKIT